MLYCTCTLFYLVLDKLTAGDWVSGALEVARRSPFACWFSSMLYCFGGGILSGFMMAEAPIAFLSNSTSVLMASVIW